MGPIKLLFGGGLTDKNTSLKKQNQSVLNLSLKDKYPEDRPNKTLGPYVKRNGLKDYQSTSSTMTGNGLYAREIADELDIMCKGTDSPNVKVINKVANNLKLSPAGYKNSLLFTKNNGGSGGREFTTPRYSFDQKKLIKSEIEKNSVVVDPTKGLYEYDGIPFRVKMTNDE